MLDVKITVKSNQFEIGLIIILWPTSYVIQKYDGCGGHALPARFNFVKSFNCEPQCWKEKKIDLCSSALIVKHALCYADPFALVLSAVRSINVQIDGRRSQDSATFVSNVKVNNQQRIINERLFFYRNSTRRTVRNLSNPGNIKNMSHIRTHTPRARDIPYILYFYI